MTLVVWSIQWSTGSCVLTSQQVKMPPLLSARFMTHSKITPTHSFPANSPRDELNPLKALKRPLPPWYFGGKNNAATSSIVHFTFVIGKVQFMAVTSCQSLIYYIMLVNQEGKGRVCGIKWLSKQLSTLLSSFAK